MSIKSHAKSSKHCLNPASPRARFVVFLCFIYCNSKVNFLQYIEVGQTKKEVKKKKSVKWQSPR